jgi:hypothetical protein
MYAATSADAASLYAAQPSALNHGEYDITHAMFWSELPPSFVRMGCWFAYVANPRRRLSQPS